jgi:peroxiredoxin
MTIDQPTGAPAPEPSGLEPEPIEPDPIEPAEPVRRPVRRRGVGPFSLRQVTIAILAVMGTAILGTLATVPIGSTAPGLPKPDPSAFLIGSPIPGLRIGDLAPELEGDRPEGHVQLTDLNGSPIRLADLRGKAVWINFWASWCPPCQFETPTLRSIDERYRDRGLAIVAVQVQQTVEAGRDYAARYGLKYTIGADVTGTIFHAYKVFALPTQFFIDEKGVVRQIVNGPLDLASSDKIVSALLATSAQSSSGLPAASPASVPTGSPGP